MLRAISHAPSSAAEPFGTIVLDSGDRHLRRKKLTTSQGDEIMVDLAEAVLLSDGDVLVLDDGRTIEIIASREKLHEVRAGEVPLRHLAWHLGNRHLAAQIDEDRILIRRDHVIRDMLLRLGASVTDVIERFQPVHGAYHQHAGEAHDHAHSSAHSHSEHDHGYARAYDHGHAHPQSHAHAHAHDGEHDRHDRGKGKPDRYGRLPGDPHYGHNHG